MGSNPIGGYLLHPFTPIDVAEFMKFAKKFKNISQANIIFKVEKLGIDPSASRMLSERSTIWATSPIRIIRNLNLFC